MKSPTDEQLKQALCDELDCLRYHGAFPTVWLDEKRQWDGHVTSREWPWIMAEVEKKLSDSGAVSFKGAQYGSQKRLFVCLLAALITDEELGEWQMPAFGIDIDFSLRLVTAPWQTRAMAYFATIGHHWPEIAISTRRFNLPKNTTAVKPCPACGNLTQFICHSEQVCEDSCNVWITCICGHDPHKFNERLESVMGGSDEENIHAALDCWNDASGHSQQPSALTY